MKCSPTTIFLGGLVVRGACQSLPQVDLGYEIHQAIGYNVSSAWSLPV